MPSPNDDAKIHTAHRERMRERVIRDGIDGLQDHEALEVFLYSIYKRGDTNALAHRLITRFGSLAGVYDAGFGELQKVEGVGPVCAFALSTMTGHYRKYSQSRFPGRAILDNENRMAKYLHGYFKGRTTEAAYILTLDTGYRKVLCEPLGSGSFDHIDIEPHLLLDIIARRRCRYAVMAHNHTSDVAIYSAADIDTTHRVQKILHNINIKLLDHLIFDEQDYVSMAQSGKLLEL